MVAYETSENSDAVLFQWVCYGNVICLGNFPMGAGLQAKPSYLKGKFCCISGEWWREKIQLWRSLYSLTRFLDQWSYCTLVASELSPEGRIKTRIIPYGSWYSSTVGMRVCYLAISSLIQKTLFIMVVKDIPANGLLRDHSVWSKSSVAGDCMPWTSTLPRDICW